MRLDKAKYNEMLVFFYLVACLPPLVLIVSIIQGLYPSLPWYIGLVVNLGLAFLPSYLLSSFDIKDYINYFKPDKLEIYDEHGTRVLCVVMDYVVSVRGLYKMDNFGFMSYQIEIVTKVSGKDNLEVIGFVDTKEGRQTRDDVLETLLIHWEKVKTFDACKVNVRDVGLFEYIYYETHENHAK